MTRTGKQGGVLRRMGTLLSLTLALVVASAVAVTPARADTGDGSVGCNTGEICFYFTSLQSNYTRQFWYGDMNHSNDFFWDIVNNQRSNIVLMDNVQSMRNKDTECAVDMWDVTSTGVWFVYFTARRGFAGSISPDRNNGHSRC